MKKYGVSIKWLAVSSFEIKCNNLTVVTDPYVTECAGTDLTWEAIENCDIICLGHAHWDHITDIPRLVEKYHPKVLCGDMTAMPMAQWLNYTPTFIYPMYPNTELDFDDVKIRGLYGRHKNLGRGFNDLCDYINQNPLCINDPGIAALQPVGSLEYRNYLFTHPNGTKILFWGNSPTVEQRNICRELKPDIAILQRTTSVEASEKSAEFAKAIGCKIVIPHHHDFHRVDSPEILESMKDALNRIAPDCEFIVPAHGEWIDL